MPEQAISQSNRPNQCNLEKSQTCSDVCSQFLVTNPVKPVIDDKRSRERRKQQTNSLRVNTKEGKKPIYDKDIGSIPPPSPTSSISKKLCANQSNVKVVARIRPPNKFELVSNYNKIVVINGQRCWSYVLLCIRK